MARENVELLQRGYELLNAGRRKPSPCTTRKSRCTWPGSLTAWSASTSETPYRGVDGVLQFLSQMSEAWEESKRTPEAYHDAGDDVLVDIRFTGRGKSSAIAIERAMAHICTVRDGQLVSHETFWDRNEARAAVRLPRLDG